MASSLSLDLQTRTVTGKKVKYLRNEGILPATVYGKGVAPISVQVDDRAFHAVYRKAGRTTLIDLNIIGVAAQAAFVQDVQRHPVSRLIIHVDLRVVDMKASMLMEVPVALVGEPAAVKRGDALVNHGIGTIQVRGLPANLPHTIEVDVNDLEVGKSIYVRDLPKHDLYSYASADDELIVSVVATREVAEEVPAEPAPVEPELIRKGKKDEEV